MDTLRKVIDIGDMLRVLYHRPRGPPVLAFVGGACSSHRGVGAGRIGGSARRSTHAVPLRASAVR